MKYIKEYSEFTDQEYSSKLMKYFNRSQKADEMFPSEEISKLIGYDIHKEWLLPNDMDRNKAGRIIHNYYLDIKFGSEYEKDLGEKNLNLFYNDLIKLNPELNLNPKNIKDIYDICYGAVSKYNLNDIIYFISVPFDKRPSELMYRKSQIEKKLGTCVEFVPSPSTLEEIEKHLK